MGDGNGNLLGCQAEDFDTGCRALVTISRPLHFKLVGGGGCAVWGPSTCSQGAYIILVLYMPLDAV